VSGWNLNFF